MYNVLEQGSHDHRNLIEQLKKKNLQIAIELNDKLMCESTNSSVWNDQIITELHSIQERVEKFLEDLRHDTPTGKSSVFIYIYFFCILDCMHLQPF